jgi:hypothetical protein
MSHTGDDYIETLLRNLQDASRRGNQAKIAEIEKEITQLEKLKEGANFLKVKSAFASIPTPPSTKFKIYDARGLIHYFTNLYCTATPEGKEQIVDVLFTNIPKLLFIMEKRPGARWTISEDSHTPVILQSSIQKVGKSRKSRKNRRSNRRARTRKN